MKRTVLVVAVWVAVAALAAVAFTTAARIAENDGPQLSKRQVDATLAATAESRAEAGRSAASARTAKADEKPASYSRRYNMPEAAKHVSARTAVEMGTTWNATLENPDCAAGSFDAASIAALGGSASIVRAAECWGTWQSTEFFADIIVTYGSLNDESRAAAVAWALEYVGEGTYIVAFTVWAVTASAPGDSESEYIVGGGVEIGEPPVVDYRGPASITAAASISVSGVYAKSGRISSVPSSRSLMDYSDHTGGDVWYADEDTTVTVTCGNCSASGALGWAEGEVELGSNVVMTASLALDSAPEANTVYARIADIRWGGISPCDAASTMYLYNPGVEGTDPYNDDWCQEQSTSNCYRVSAGNTIEICHLQGSSDPEAFTGVIGAPLTVAMTPPNARHDAVGPAYSPPVEFTGPFIRWVWDAVAEAYVSEVIPFSDVITATQADKSWCYTWQWQTLSTANMTATVTEDWREDNGEAVGATGAAAAQCDRVAGLTMWPITATDRVSDPLWSSGITWSHASRVNINDTEGLPSRASPWVAGAGVTVDPANNDSWTVAAGASAPVVSRSLATRYWLRMARLADHLDDPDAEHNPDWPIMLKANLSLVATQDDPDWWSAATGGVDAEDVTNWSNYSYIRLGITAPRAGTVRVTVNYRVPTVEDPCYTGFAYRYGSEGEFEYTTDDYTVSWDAAVVAGANSVQLDYALNREHVQLVHDRRLCHVTSVTIALPAGGEEDEVWELTDLALEEDAAEGAPDAHLYIRFKQHWGWIGTKWFGLGGFCDGHPILNVDYGFGDTAGEWGLLYIQHRQHNPDSEATDRLDSVKALSRMFDELGWQEGFTTAQPGTSPETSAYNQDADDGQVDTALWAYDMLQSDQNVQANVQVALCVGTYQCAYGLQYSFEVVYKYPQGRLHGIALNAARTDRVRSQADAVNIYESIDDGTSYTLIEQADVGANGYWQSLPVRELGGPYKAGRVAGLYVVNREYTVAIGVVGTPTAGATYVATTRYPGTEHLITIHIQEGAMRVVELDTDDVTPTFTLLGIVDTSGDYDSPSIETYGPRMWVQARKTADEALYHWHSDNYGGTWTGPTLVAPA